MANQRNQLVKVCMRLAHSRLYVVTSNLNEDHAGLYQQDSERDFPCIS